MRLEQDGVEQGPIVAAGVEMLGQIARAPPKGLRIRKACSTESKAEASAGTDRSDVVAVVEESTHLGINSSLACRMSIEGPAIGRAFMHPGRVPARCTRPLGPAGTGLALIRTLDDCFQFEVRGDW